MSQTLDARRVIDPVLTEHARGYKHPDRVGMRLFPSAEVGVSAGRVLEFGKESFQLYNARRAPGAATKRIEFGYEGKPFALVQDALESKVPREHAREAQSVPGVDIGLRATNVVMQSVTLALEVEQAGLATDPFNYPAANRLALSGTSQWSDAASRPLDNIADARQVVRKACGLYPNIGILGPIAYKALKNHATVIGRFLNQDVVTNEALAKLLELDILLEGRAVVADGLGSFQDVWGNAMVMAYAPQTSAGPEEPSYGYTYTLRGNPFVEQAYYDNNTKSWIYGATYERAPVLAGMDAGFLFSNVVAD